MKTKSDETKRKQIHDYLKLGYSITKLDCIMMFGYINLGDYIHILRKKYGSGYIKTMWLRNNKTGFKYAAYSINENTKRCFKCKHASSGFKIAGKTHHQCNKPKHEKGFEMGILSPWDTLQNWYNTCEDYEIL